MPTFAVRGFSSADQALYSDYTNSNFSRNNIKIMTRTMVKDVTETTLKALDADKNPIEIPFGLLVWATGNTARQVTRTLMNDLGTPQEKRRGLAVDDHMRVLGAEHIWAMGDCTQTAYAPTAQVASQQGGYIARQLNQAAQASRIEAALEDPAILADSAKVEKLRSQLAKAQKMLPFHYSHQGSLAYVGSEKAIADIPFIVSRRLQPGQHLRTKTSVADRFVSFRTATLRPVALPPCSSGAQCTSLSSSPSATGCSSSAIGWAARFWDAMSQGAQVLLRAVSQCLRQ